MNGVVRMVRLDASMWIRIIKTAPAPLMDGFDLSGFRTGRLYQTDAVTARYLVVAGYAVLETRPSDRRGTGATSAD